MSEYTIYEYLRAKCGGKRSIEKSHALSLVGEFGLDVLENARLISSYSTMDGRSRYVLICEPVNN